LLGGLEEYVAELMNQTTKGRHLGRLLGSPNLDAFELDDEGSIPFLKVDDLNRFGDSLYLEGSGERMRALGAGPRLFEGEIILFPKTSAAIFTNKVKIVRGPVLFDSNLMGWQLFDTVSIKYLVYTLLARSLSDLADVSSVPQINNKHIYPSSFPLPPRGQQETIADFLDAETVKIGLLITKIYAGIEKLKEYRTALISAAVTGKIDVRGKISSRTGNLPERDAAISE
jgi:type I restriction enzyme S subunit